MISHFLSLEWKQFFRSASFSKSIGAKILIGFFALYFAACFLLIGIGGYWILKKQFPELEVIDWGKKPPNSNIVINTTSVGLAKNEELKIDFSDYGKNSHKNFLFYDLIYNPKETAFLKKARLRGNKTMNGKMMFLNQAKYAFNIWTNIMPEIDNDVIELLD